MNPYERSKFLLNLRYISQISGIAIITVGAIIEAAYYKYEDFVDPNLSKPPIALICVGVVVFMVAFCGCCGAIRENLCLINTVINC